MKLISTLALSLTFLLSTAVNADTLGGVTNWALDSENSMVNFVTIKKGNIAETHRFTEVSGHIIDDKALITIQPDSVDSRVPIRNERMREFLFETGLYPTIEVSANTKQLIRELNSGTSALVTIPAKLSMHGVIEELNLEVRLSRLDLNTLIVASTQPVLVRAANYNMVAGITKLSSLVNNLPIAETVPVNFSLVFTSN
jgi:polyisoprenoid-binding protein YceI